MCFTRWTFICWSSSCYIPQSSGFWSKPVCLCVCTCKHHILLSQFPEKPLSPFVASNQFSTTFEGRVISTLVLRKSQTSPAPCTFTRKAGCDLIKSDKQSMNPSSTALFISQSWKVKALWSWLSVAFHLHCAHPHLCKTLQVEPLQLTPDTGERYGADPYSGSQRWAGWLAAVPVDPLTAAVPTWTPPLAKTKKHQKRKNKTNKKRKNQKKKTKNKGRLVLWLNECICVMWLTLITGGQDMAGAD